MLVLSLEDFEAACARVPSLRHDLYRHFGAALRKEREHLKREETRLIRIGADGVPDCEICFSARAD